MSEERPLRSATVLVAVFLIAICGLIYELVAGTLSSYLLGDSTTQFSLTIGLFLTSMGVGSWLSRFIRRRVVFWFVLIELLVGVIGGFSALLAFTAFATSDLFLPVVGLNLFAVGLLVGLEIPLVLRILEDVRSLRITVANVLSLDYLGALAASLVFPFALVPHVGLIRGSLLVGLVNVLVAGFLWRALRPEIGPGRRLLGASMVAAGFALAVGAWQAEDLSSRLEDAIYQDEIILARSSAYQRIVITRWHDDIRLYLNGHLQFSSVDEYRYHESLALPPFAAATESRRILVLGGGDGLLARRLLDLAEPELLRIVDLDPEVTRLFREVEMLRRLNGDSLRDERVELVHEDALAFLERDLESYDLIYADLPDPSEPALAKLYSRSFYALAARRLSPGGILATQATSPFRSREAFWCIARTIADVEIERGERRLRLQARPYHVHVPTFGSWGFVMAGFRDIDPEKLQLRAGDGRYIAQATLAQHFRFPPDMGPLDVPLNSLDDPALATLYRRGYHQYLD